MLATSLHAQTYTRLHGFNTTDGANPVALMQAKDGNFYGIAAGGGTNSVGTLFKITSTGRLTTIYNFCSRTLCADGEYPVGTPIQSTDGNFYGVTAGGGTGGHGTIYKITPAGVETVLYSFCGTGYPVCPDGYSPEAGLVRASNGAFYGTAQSGGGADGCGTVFKVTAAGHLTTLHKFDDADGCFPATALIQASDGNLYGTVEGNIFRMTLAGALTTLYTFCCDSVRPLIQGTDGNIYGTTSGQPSGYGRVFQMTLGGTVTTLHTFCSETNCSDGAYPRTGLIEASDGNFYGTTAGIAVGSVFEITPAGALTTLYTFCSLGGCTDGEFPNSLVFGTNGKFYGTTYSGGLPRSCSSFGCGVVFSLATGLQPDMEPVDHP